MTIEKHDITDRQSWLEMRRQDLTASDLAAICGCDAYRSALSVFSEKLGLVMVEESPIMRRGRWLEHAAYAALVESYPNMRFIKPATYLRDPEIRLGATPDCIGEDEDAPGLVNCQIKTVSRPTFEKWNGQVPMGYMLQTLCEGMLMDARTSYLVAFVISTYTADLILFEVPRHKGAEIKIRQTAVDFWHDMEAGLMPKPDYKRDAEVISALYSIPTPESVIDLSSSNRLGEVLAERASRKAIIKENEEAVEALDTEIKAALGDNEIGTLPDWKVSWKMQHRKAFTVPEKSSRVLRVTDLREDIEEQAA